MNDKNNQSSLKNLPRNIWAVSLTSFFMDISSEMVVNILPLFLSNVLGVGTSVIGAIEGLAESLASLLKLFSGWLSDKLRGRKWIAVAGYGLSALAKPFFYFANSWQDLLQLLLIGFIIDLLQVMLVDYGSLLLVCSWKGVTGSLGN